MDPNKILLQRVIRSDQRENLSEEDMKIFGILSRGIIEIQLDLEIRTTIKARTPNKVLIELDTYLLTLFTRSQ